ncbi:glycosyltransferase, partial [uncultured Clostridium sp.]|uniref:glycosyltransferase family 2 protein n=2 Tax=uncultured Clostridium sp. TaxID=59620 RepID=UPI00261E8486
LYMEKLVSIAIVNWNGEKYLYKCIKSLLNQNYKNIEIIVIDNDSTDNSVKIIEENFLDSIKLFRNKNTGYAD